MARGTQGGASTGPASIATSDIIATGNYAGQKMQVALVAYGPDTAPVVVAVGTGLPVALDATSLAALETTELGAASLAALESITAAVSGPVTPASLGGTVLATVVTVGTTALALPATALTGRRTALLQADAANTAAIFLGGSAVTADAAATGGIPLAPGQAIALDLGAAVIYGRSTAASQKIIVLEAS